MASPNSGDRSNEISSLESRETGEAPRVVSNYTMSASAENVAKESNSRDSSESHDTEAEEERKAHEEPESTPGVGLLIPPVPSNGESSSWLDGSDSCHSVSPSPGAEADESFSFGEMTAFGGATEELSAALQAEKEFLDFMCSLPQVQESTTRLKEEIENPAPREEVSSLDHLGHLCRVVEQLAQLKEQNVRLQRRVQYLEDLRILHKMHRHVTETLAQEQENEEIQTMDLESQVPARPSNDVKQVDPEPFDTTAMGFSGPPPPTAPGPHFRPSLPAREAPQVSPSETGGRRRGTVGDATVGVVEVQKEKKGHRSAWGKVKHIITRKDAKKSPRMVHNKSTLGAASSSSPYVPLRREDRLPQAAGEARLGGPAPPDGGGSLIRSSTCEESLASSDTEDYEYDPEDAMDPDGDLGGIWMGPKDPLPPKLDPSRERPLSPQSSPGFPSTQSINSPSTQSNNSPLTQSINSPSNQSINSPTQSTSSPSTQSINSSPSDAPSKLTPLYLASTSPSTTSSLSPSTPPSSSIASHGLPSSTTSSPSSSSPHHPHASPHQPHASLIGEGDPPEPQMGDGYPHLPPERGGRREERFKPQLTITVPSSEDLRPAKTSHWSKVKQAFLAPPAAGLTRTVSMENTEGMFSPSRRGGASPRLRDDRGPRGDICALEGGSSGGSLPPTPKTRSSFTFDGVAGDHSRGSGSPDLIHQRSPSLAPRCTVGGDLDLSSPPGSGGGGGGGGGSSPSVGDTPSGGGGGTSVPGAAHSLLSAGGAVGRNLADLQRALSGEFSKKLLEWERLKGQQWLYGGPMTGLTSPKGGAPPHIPDPQWGHQAIDGNLPHEFKKKLHEWEKMKEKEKHHGGSGPVSPTSPGTQHTPPLAGGDTKTRRHEEGTLPPEFRKRLTEWEIGKVLAGKSRQNVEELQKNLGEEFNRKLAEWERMKAGGLADGPPGMGETPPSLMGLDRKGSVHKVKKNKNKSEKIAAGKSELPKTKEKEVQWLERELGKIEREKQRLEREKERYIEREARLERMWQAQKQAQKQEVLIKTSTGEFRFEGISESFTRRLYEWEQRRGIRPESSTIALLAPPAGGERGLQEPREAGGDATSPPGPPPRQGGAASPPSVDLTRLHRCRSESSVAELGVPPQLSPAAPHRGENNQLKECHPITEHKASSEPILSADEVRSEATSPLRVAVQTPPQPQQPPPPKRSSLTLPFEKIAEEDATGMKILKQLSEAVQVTEEDLLDKILRSPSVDVDSATTSGVPNQLNEQPATSSGLVVSNDAPVKNSTSVKSRRKTSVSRQSSSRSLASLKAAYAPEEITRLIDSSDSDVDDLECRDPEEGEGSLRPPRLVRAGDSLRSDASYQDLLQENMSLLEQLRTQEVVCRALQTQMGDIDCKMDSVTDQHIKTLEKLHEQVTIMKDSVAATESATEDLADSESLDLKASEESLAEADKDKMDTDETEGRNGLPEDDITKEEFVESFVANEGDVQESQAETNRCGGAGEAEATAKTDKDLENQLLIQRLRQRIVELELKGESLQRDKEKLEASFQLHKEREAKLAQSLLLRMRDLHVAEVDRQSSASAPELPLDPANRRTRSVEECSGEREECADPHASSSSLGDSKRHLLPENSFLQTQSFDDSSIAVRKKNRSFKRQRRVYEEDQEPKFDAGLHRAPKIVGVELKSQCSSNAKVPSGSGDVESQGPARSTSTSGSRVQVETLQGSGLARKEVSERKASQKLPRKSGASLPEIPMCEKVDPSKRKSKLQAAEKRSAERRGGTTDRKRRSRQRVDDRADEDEEDDAYNAKKYVRKKKKTPTKKVLKLHSLTADLLLQAKRLEQALVSRQQLVKNDTAHGNAASPSGGVKGVPEPQKGGLRGHSSLRVVGEAPPRHQTRHLPKVPGQTRTWSSIETIASPSEVPARRLGAGADKQQTPLGDSQQDLLELNAEISRMAKELRLQMMDLWTFTESTSPESVSSEGEDLQRVEKISSSTTSTEAQRQLFIEAQEVFNSIASLGRSQEASTISTPRSPSPVDLQFPPAGPPKMAKSCSFDPFISHSYPRGDASSDVGSTGENFKLPHSYSFPSSPTLRESSKLERKHQRSDRSQRGEKIPRASFASAKSFEKNESSAHPAEAGRPPDLLPTVSSLINGESLQKENLSKVTFYIDSDAGPALPPSPGKFSDGQSHSPPILKSSPTSWKPNKVILDTTEVLPAPLRTATPRESFNRDEQFSKVEENNFIAGNTSYDDVKASTASTFTENSTTVDNWKNRSHFDAANSRHKLDAAGRGLPKSDLHENHYENFANRKRFSSGESHASADKKHHRQSTCSQNDVHFGGDKIEERMNPTLEGSVHEERRRLTYGIPAENSSLYQSNSGNLNRHEYGCTKHRSRNDMQETGRISSSEKNLSSQSLKEFTDSCHPLNVPDLEQLLPRGSETTFADLVRVHDELYRIEQEKQRVELASTKKNVLGKRSPTQQHKHKDHLREAYENSQLRMLGAASERPVHQKDLKDTHLKTNNSHSNNNDARRSPHVYDEKSPSKLGSQEVFTEQWSTPERFSSKSSPLGSKQSVTDVRVPCFELGNFPEASESVLADLEHEKVHMSASKSSTNTKQSKDERYFTHNCDDSSLDGKSPYNTWRSTASSRSFDQALSTSFEWEFQPENNSSHLEAHPQTTPPAPRSHVGPSLMTTALQSRSNEKFEIGNGNSVKSSNKVNASTATTESMPKVGERPHRRGRSPFETEVTHEQIHTPHGRLRARRVSDSQVEYHETDGREVKRKVSVRLASNVFVPTKRTIFTPASKDQATPTFLQSATDEPILTHGHHLRAQMCVPSQEISHPRDKETQIKDISKRNGHKAGPSSSPRLQPKVSTSRSPNPEAPSVTVESKRKVLEAANRNCSETSPTVKGMIELYNRRITERQSLLTSPSKYWISDSFNSSNLRDNRPSGTSSAESTLRNTHARSRVEAFEFPEPTSPDLIQGMVQNPSSFLARGSPAISSGGNSTLETSLDMSADETDSSCKARAFKLKQAKEEFFSRRPNNSSQRNKDVRERSSSDSKTLEPSSNVPSTSQSSNLVSKATDTRDKPKKEYIKTRNEKQVKDSLEPKKTGAVQKSASTQNVDQRFPLPIRQSSTEPALYSKSPKRILKLFKRSKDKHKKEMGAVEHLCRLSMEVNIEKIPDRSHTRSSSLTAPVVGSGNRTSSPSVETCPNASPNQDDQSRNTLPRSSIGSQGSPSARSCPSSPVSPGKSKPSGWLARGKEFLKGRSPSPSVFRPT